MRDIVSRLRRLEANYAGRLAGQTAFRLEDGTMFYTDLDPVSYLLQNGVETARGRIVAYSSTFGTGDPLSTSIAEYIDELIGGKA